MSRKEGQYAYVFDFTGYIQSTAYIGDYDKWTLGFWLYSKTIVQRWQIVSKFKQSSVYGFASKVYNSMLCYALDELRQSCLTS